MPLDIQDDMVLWLKNQGMPVNTKNLNVASAHLSEHPEDRPSYKDGAPPEEGSEMERMILEQTRAPTPEGLMSGANPKGSVNDSSSSSPPSDAFDVPGSDPKTNAALRGVMGRPGMKDINKGSVNEMGNDPSMIDETISRTTEPPEMKESEGLDLGRTATMGGAALAGVATLTSQLKKAMDQAGNDQWVRDGFAKNVSSRVNRDGTSSMPEALDEAIRAIRDGDLTTAQKNLSMLDDAEQGRLKSILSNPPNAVRRPSPAAGRAGNSMMDLMKTIVTRGR